MDYPSDSTIAAQPVADQYGQGSSYAAFHDQIYSTPPTAGAGGDSASFANQSFAPDQTAAAVLPPYEGLDEMAVQENATLPTEGAAGQEEVNPWDTYVMDPTATGGETASVPGEVSAEPGDALAPSTDGSAGQLDAASPEEALAQVEQHLTQKFDEVVQLGTATPLDQEKFGAAVTELVQTAELMGAFRTMAQGATAQPGDPGVQPGAEAMQPETLLPEQAAMQPEALPAEEQAAMQPEALPTEEQAAMQPEALPTEEQAAMQPETLPTEEQAAMQPELTDPNGAQFATNPYEPQVPPVSSEAMAGPQEFASAAGDQLTQLQDQLGSQITQLMSFTSATPMNTSLPSGGPQEGGNVDNFKTALLNVVKTAEQIGSVAQTIQPAQPDESTQTTSMG